MLMCRAELQNHHPRRLPSSRFHVSSALCLAVLCCGTSLDRSTKGLDLLVASSLDLYATLRRTLKASFVPLETVGALCSLKSPALRCQCRVYLAVSVRLLSGYCGFLLCGQRRREVWPIRK